MNVIILGLWNLKIKKLGVVNIKRKVFFGDFLCDGIRVSYTHPWLLKDFYDIIESLENVINEYQGGISVAQRYITGNYEGTEIKIEISK